MTVATDWDGSPLLLLSRLSSHTLNLEADPRASLLLAETGKGDPLAHPRLTVIGAAPDATPERRGPLALPGPPPESRALRRFRRLLVLAARHRGRPPQWRLRPSRFGDRRRPEHGPVGGRDAAGAEEGALEHLNADHAEALALYATRLAGAPAGAWRRPASIRRGSTSLAGDRTARLAFPEPVKTPDALRRVLKRLADEARAA